MESPRKKQKLNNSLCVWDFTFWGSKENVLEFCKEECKKWTFQQEKAPTTGKLHFQGRVSLKTKMREAELGRIVKAYGCQGQVSPTSKENATNTFYVTKAETRVNGPWANTDVYIPWNLELDTLRPWQQSVISKLDVKEDRHINVVVDDTGNHGKSVLMGYLEVNGFGQQIPPVNKAQDLAQATCSIVRAYEKRGKRAPKAFFVDFPRALKQSEQCGLFSGLETIKGGWVYDIRYEFYSKRIDPPQIWVFMNTKPELGMLTPDRWKFWTIRDMKLYKYRSEHITNCVIDLMGI